MAGPDPDGVFVPDDFRAPIRAAMMMGLPEDVALRPTFHFPTAKTHTAPVDPGGRPWDFTASPATAVTPDPVLALCLVEVDAGSKGYTSAGKFEARRATLSFFEDEWAAVFGFEWVSIGGKRFDLGAELEPQGLFEVTLRRVEVTAADI